EGKHPSLPIAFIQQGEPSLVKPERVLSCGRIGGKGGAIMTGLEGIGHKSFKSLEIGFNRLFAFN
ncbi:hypothetical protein A2U01_0050415, partial [Trifolium medium]|nr:hypothetical protein [Trifolium medium]